LEPSRGQTDRPIDEIKIETIHWRDEPNNVLLVTVMFNIIHVIVLTKFNWNCTFWSFFKTMIKHVVNLKKNQVLNNNKHIFWNIIIWVGVRWGEGGIRHVVLIFGICFKYVIF